MAIQAMNFYDYLRRQFSDLETAKRWAYKWANEMGQEIPEFGGMTSRAMAAHISAILDGKSEDNSGTDYLTNYLETRYGPEIYLAMWSCAP